MPILSLTTQNQSELRSWLDDDTLLVACLCAAWCDVCRDYRSAFEELAIRHPAQHFVWIDIEDQADALGDFEVDNFPTLLIQRGDTVGFFGTVPPGLALADRLVQAQIGVSAAESVRATAASPERQGWQTMHLARRLDRG